MELNRRKRVNEQPRIAFRGLFVIWSVMIRLLAPALTVLLASFAMAQEPATLPADARERGAGRAPTSQPIEDKLSTTQHEIAIAGQPMTYSATAGTIVMKDEAGKPKANFYFTAYTRTPADSSRPVTFVFNGGPGSSSVWLHMGCVGPRRIEFPPDGVPGPPPYRLVDNSETWLTFTDLVLIDPVGTGFSRPAPGEDGKQFWGVEQDAASVADFIRLYLTRYQRWTSPKFLAGESYGTTRAARLSELLADRHGINLNGIVLISAVLNFQTLRPADNNDLPYVLYLPTYTYVAGHHKKLAAELTVDLKQTLREVEQFAVGEYQTALTRGAQLSPEERKSLLARLSRYTGLPEALIDAGNLRISPSTFQKRILESDRKVIGRFDGRMTGFDNAPLAPTPSFDPSYSAYIGPYASTFNSYVREQLKFESDLPYEILTGRVQPWDFGPAGNGYLNVADEMASAMTKYPHMHVFVAEGMHDFATPYFASDYTIGQLNISPEVRKNITRTYYEGGHMMYHMEASRQQLLADVRVFYQGAIPK